MLGDGGNTDEENQVADDVSLSHGTGLVFMELL